MLADAITFSISNQDNHLISSRWALNPIPSIPRGKTLTQN